MKNHFKIILKSTIILLLLSMFFTACQPEEEENLLPMPPDANREGMVQLGKKLENPYSLANMQKAYNNLQANRANARLASTELEATHLYVRFLPSDTTELYQLYADTTLELYEYPLDYEILAEGGTYHDPDIPLDRPTWQYTVVQPDYEFPIGIRHEVLETLFLPEAVEEGSPNARTTFSNGFLDELEDEALRMTDNWEEPIVPSNARCRGRKCWTPKGKIQVQEMVDITGPDEDERLDLGLIPVQNVKVRARRWFTIKTAYTNANGDFRIDEFKRDVNYSIQWETNYAKITSWGGFATSFNGPKRGGDWNADFTYANEHWVRATLINAAVEYRKQYHRHGIQNPYPITYWAGGEAVNKLNIRAAFKQGTGNMFPARANNIIIFADRNRDNVRKGTDELYRVTFHELAHQSHWKLNGWNITFSSKILRESWADYVEHLFTRIYYPLDTDKQDENRDDMADGYSAIF